MSALRDELINDPLGRGYSGLSDQAAADDLNDTTTGITRAVDFVGGGDILNATDDVEYDALTATKKDQWLSLCGVEQIDTSGGVAKSLEADFFGAGTTTRTSLSALRTLAISRAQELNLGRVREGTVAGARSK